MSETFSCKTCGWSRIHGTYRQVLDLPRKWAPARAGITWGTWSPFCPRNHQTATPFWPLKILIRKWMIISLTISKIKVFEFLFYHFTSQQLHLYRFWCHSTVAASKRAGSRSWKGNCPKSAKYKTTSDTLPTPRGQILGKLHRIHRCQWCQRSRFKIVGWSEIPR